MKQVIEDNGSSSESSIGLGGGGKSDPEMELLFPGEKMGRRKAKRGKKKSESKGLLRKGEH